MLVLLIVVFSFTGEGFFTWISFQNIITSTSLFLLIGIGETFVMISGGIDISLPSNLAFSALGAGILMTRFYSGHGEGIGLVVVVGLLIFVVGGLVGLINGLIISFMNVSPLILTLGTWGAFLRPGRVAVGDLPGRHPAPSELRFRQRMPGSTMWCG